MLKKLDRYIIYRFIQTFFFIIALLMTISVVFDISEKLDDFLEKQPTIGQVIFDYYLNFVLYYGNLFSPLIIFLSLIYFTSRMAQRTEIVAMMSGGVSFNRFLRPFLIAATILAGTALVLNHLIIPRANKTRLAFEEKFYKSRNVNTNQDLHREVSPGKIVYFKSVDLGNREGRQLALEQWEDGKLTDKIMAIKATQDAETKKWKMENYVIRSFGDGEEKVRQGLELDTLLGFDMKEFIKSVVFVSSMDYFELEQYLEKARLSGTDKMPYYLVEKHQRTSYPFATYVLTIIGVSVASRKVRGGIGVQIAIGVLVTLLYVFAMKVTTVSATNAGLDPLLATWLPNIIFAFLAFILYRKARK